MEWEPTCSGTWQMLGEGIREGRSYITHFFLQLRKQGKEAQRGEAGCSRSHSLWGGEAGPNQLPDPVLRPLGSPVADLPPRHVSPVSVPLGHVGQRRQVALPGPSPRGRKG